MHVWSELFFDFGYPVLFGGLHIGRDLGVNKIFNHSVSGGMFSALVVPQHEALVFVIVDSIDAACNRKGPVRKREAVKRRFFA